MIWLTWRQYRKQALFTLAGLAAVAALMIPTGLAMHHAFVDFGLPGCMGDAAAATEPCELSLSQFLNQYST